MNKVKFWLPTIVVFAAISYLSSIPNLHLVDESLVPAWWLKFIQQHVVYIGKSGFFSYALSLHPDFIAHKLGHITLFGLLGAALCYGTGGRFTLAVLLALVCATGDEFHQAFVPGRSCRLGDIILDVTAAAVVSFVLLRLFRGKCRRAERDKLNQ